jgi:hypothetical protein
MKFSCVLLATAVAGAVRDGCAARGASTRRVWLRCLRWRRRALTLSLRRRMRAS